MLALTPSSVRGFGKDTDLPESCEPSWIDRVVGDFGALNSSTDDGSLVPPPSPNAFGFEFEPFLTSLLSCDAFCSFSSTLVAEEGSCS